VYKPRELSILFRRFKKDVSSQDVVLRVLEGQVETLRDTRLCCKVNDNVRLVLTEDVRHVVLLGYVASNVGVSSLFWDVALASHIVALVDVYDFMNGRF